MKTRLTIAIASLLAASLGATAFAQDAPQVPPQQQTPPAQQMPPQQTPPEQPMPSQQMPSRQTPPESSMATSGNAASGTRVAHEIKRALTRNGITATHVKVTVDNGTATLSGTVFTKQDVAKAKQVAMQVHGVTQVDDSGLHSRKG